jgi:hypothetical protein
MAKRELLQWDETIQSCSEKKMFEKSSEKICPKRVRRKMFENISTLTYQGLISLNV